MSGKLIILSAPSGSGKTTLVKLLLEKGFPLEFSISATSRMPRAGEVDGKDYHFLTPEQFKENIDKDNFVEWEEVYAGTCYGTMRSEVERIWNKGNHVIFDVDVVGGVNLKKIFGEKALSLFIQPPSVEELERRLRNRSTEDEAGLKKRLDKAAFEMTFAAQFDKIIVNDNLELAFKELEMLVSKFIL